MLASHGYFELKAAAMDKLLAFLKDKPAFGQVIQENGLLQVFLNQEMDADTLNSLLYKEGIVLSHLVKRKESLEQQFLTLTKNQPDQHTS